MRPRSAVDEPGRFGGVRPEVDLVGEVPGMVDHEWPVAGPGGLGFPPGGVNQTEEVPGEGNFLTGGHFPIVTGDDQVVPGGQYEVEEAATVVQETVAFTGSRPEGEDVVPVVDGRTDGLVVEAHDGHHPGRDAPQGWWRGDGHASCSEPRGTGQRAETGGQETPHVPCSDLDAADDWSILSEVVEETS